MRICKNSLMDSGICECPTCYSPPAADASFAPASGSPIVAALFVQANGCYSGLPGVDAWPESRDAGCVILEMHITETNEAPFDYRTVKAAEH